jgi:hypothetical protein
MSLVFATWFARLVYIYIGIGLLLLPWWHMRGLRRLDAVAAKGPWGFRVLISPGLVVLWPWMLARAARAPGHPTEERNAHRVRAHARPTA